MKTIRSTHDYQMLRSRFLSLFLWPALLSSVKVADEMQDVDRTVASVASLLGSGRLEREVVDKETDSVTQSMVAVVRDQKQTHRCVENVFIVNQIVAKFIYFFVVEFYIFLHPIACVCLGSCF